MYLLLPFRIFRLPIDGTYELLPMCMKVYGTIRIFVLFMCFTPCQYFLFIYIPRCENKRFQRYIIYIVHM